MSSHKSLIRRNNRIAATVCGCIFCLFSISWLGVLEEPLLGLIHTLYSQGRSSYSPWVGAFILTALFALLAWVLNLFTRFRGRWVALSYFPSFLLLSLLVSLEPEPGGHGEAFSLVFPEGRLVWTALLLLLYAGVAVAYRRFSFSFGKMDMAELLNPNLAVMALMSCAAGASGNAGDLFLYETSVARSIEEGNADRAILVGQKSLQNGRTLSALRSLALSQKGMLGESLFAFPKTGEGASELFLDESQGAVSLVTNADIFSHLGADSVVVEGDVTAMLRRLSHSDEATRPMQDYYLCALLLEGRLSDFREAVLHFNDGIRPLPRHYQEALLLEMHDASDSLMADTLCTSEVKERFAAFGNLQCEHADRLPRKNYTRRRFGDTYWWYYHYGRKQ